MCPTSLFLSTVCLGTSMKAPVAWRISWFWIYIGIYVLHLFYRNSIVCMQLLPDIVEGGKRRLIRIIFEKKTNLKNKNRMSPPHHIFYQRWTINNYFLLPGLRPRHMAQYYPEPVRIMPYSHNDISDYLRAPSGCQFLE